MLKEKGENWSLIQYLKDEKEINVQRESQAKTLVLEKMKERHMAGS